MTDKPNTLSIDQTEWRVLFASTIARVTEYVNQTHALTPDHLKLMHDHLDRAKLIASAWCAASPAPVQDIVQAAQPVAAQANGATEPKRRGGWPKGKKRNQPQQAVQ